MGRKLRRAQTNFTRGELSALMASRYDMRAYANGAQQLRNLAPLVQGGVRTRPALAYLGTIPQYPAVLADFVFNDDQRYAFVFSNGRVDIYHEAASWASVASLTSAPWTEAMLGELTWSHYGDTMIVFHRDLRMQIIKRTGATTFTRTDFAFEENSGGTETYQPYFKFADPAMTLAASATSGSVTLTLSGAGAFTDDHIGFIVRKDGIEIEITAVASATSATGTCAATITTAATADWDEAVFSDARGWAISGEFHDDRLWILGTKSRPTGRYFSKIGAYFNFDLGTTQDNEASWESVTGPRLSELRFGVSGRHLLMLADRAVFFQPQSETRPITPQNASSPEQAPVGTAFVKPVVYDDGVFMVHKEGAVVSKLSYNDVDQAYKPVPMTHMAPHLIQAPTSMTVLYDSPNRPEQYCIMTNGDGCLTVLHSNEAEEIRQLTPWETAGTFKDTRAIGKDVLCLVERELNSSTVWTLECFDDDAAPTDACMSKTNGSAGKTFTGFTHLANEAVQVTTNGHPLGEYTVDGSGVITLDDLAPEVTTIEAGLGFTQTIQPMPAVFDLPDGESRGRVMGLVRGQIQVDRSNAFAVNDTAILLQFAGDDFSEAPPTKTGIVEFSALGYDEDAAPVIQITAPVKVTILGMIREVEVND